MGRNIIVMSIKKRSRFWLKIAVVQLAVLTVAIVLWKIWPDEEKSQVESSNERAYRHIEVDGKQYDYNTNMLTLLCMGIDTTDDSEGQSDVIDLMVLDRENEKMKILSFSRDSMVPIRIFDASGKSLGWEEQHLALASSYGSTQERGCLLTCEAVSKLIWDIPIVYYAGANLSAFEQFQDLVGSFTVQVPDDSLASLGEEYQKGNTVTITSENAELFVRSRDTDVDFSNTSRMQRQRVYIDGYVQSLRKQLQEDFNGTVTRATGLLSQVVTNISIDEVSDFAKMIMDYEFSAEEDYIVVEGSEKKGLFHDEYHIDETELQKLILETFYTQK